MHFTAPFGCDFPTIIARVDGRSSCGYVDRSRINSLHVFGSAVRRTHIPHPRIEPKVVVVLDQE